MALDNSLEKQIKNYLLGQLPDREEEVFEERLMDDPQLFKEVGSSIDLVEDGLVEDYLEGNLDKFETNAFEQRLLNSPRIKEKIVLGKTLIKTANRSESSDEVVHRHSRKRWMDRFISLLMPKMKPAGVMAGVLLILLVSGGSWSLLKISRLEGRVTVLQDEFRDTQIHLNQQLSNEQTRNTDLENKLTGAETNLVELRRMVEQLGVTAISPVVSKLLFDGSFRGTDQEQKISLSDQNSIVELLLSLGIDDYIKREVVLYNARTDGEILHLFNVQTRELDEDVVAVVQIPVNLLPADIYTAKLIGTTEDGENEISRFRFTTQKK